MAFIPDTKSQSTSFIPDEAPLTRPAGINKGTNRVEDLIAQRPSAVRDLQQEASNPAMLLLNALGLNPRRPGSQLQLARQALGASGEQVEGAISSAGLGVQRGQPLRQTGSQVIQSLMGQRPAKLSDVMRETGDPLMGSDPVANTIGFLGMAGLGGLGQGSVARKASSLGKSATQSGFKAVTKPPIEFLKGSPKLVDKVERQAHTFIQDLRQGGQLHEPFFERLNQVSDEAWAPMKELAASVDEPTSVNEIVDELNRMFPDDPLRAKEVATIVRGTLGDTMMGQGTMGRVGQRVPGKLRALNGPELEQLSSAIGKVTPKSVLKGKLAPNMVQQFRADARSAIANILERKAPEEFKGNAALAKQQWSSYKTIQQKLYDLFVPGGAKEAETTKGVDFFRRAASNTLTQSEKDLVQQIIPTRFPELAQQMQLIIQPFAKALGRKRVGEISRNVGLVGATSGAATTLLSYLLGKHK